MANKDLKIYRAARMCPVCGEDSRVYDSREQSDGTIRRIRCCSVCGVRFSTEESFVGMVRVRRLSRSSK